MNPGSPKYGAAVLPTFAFNRIFRFILFDVVYVFYSTAKFSSMGHLNNTHTERTLVSWWAKMRDPMWSVMRCQINLVEYKDTFSSFSKSSKARPFESVMHCVTYTQTKLLLTLAWKSRKWVDSLLDWVFQDVLPCMRRCEKEREYSNVSRLMSGRRLWVA
jgi:hypothetical protein